MSIPDFLLEAIASVAAEYSDRLDLEDAHLVWNDDSVILFGSDTFHIEDRSTDTAPPDR